MNQIMLYEDKKSSSLLEQYYSSVNERFKRSDNTSEHKKRIFYKTLLLNSNFLT